MNSVENFIDAYIHVEDPPLPPEPDPIDSVRSPQEVFVEGGPIPDLPSETGSLGAYIGGGGFTSIKQAYVHSDSIISGGFDSYINGFTYEDLAPKGAIRFNAGQQQYVEVSDNTQYKHLSNGFTFNIWVRPLTDSNLQFQGIAVKQGAIETWVHPTGNSFGMRVHINGVWHQALTQSFVKNRWYMLTIRHDGSVVRFFLNGQQIHGVNALGRVTDNTNPWHFGRYITYGTYSTLDVANSQLWNHSMTNEEIADMYSPPSRESCLKAYIAIQEPSDTWSRKRSYISSPTTPGNPLRINSAQWVEFAENKQGSNIRAFIVAGGETITSWDTRFLTDPTVTRAFDTLVIVRDNYANATEIQLGNIVYPITRISRMKLDIPTEDNPRKSYEVKLAWMVSYYEAPITSRACFIPGIRFNGGRKSVFISGPFTSLTHSLGCMVINNQMPAPAQRAFIEGQFVFKHRWTRDAFIHSFSDNEAGATSAFIYGWQSASSNRGAYIPAPVWMSAWKPLFIMSVADDISAPARYGFMRGNVGMSRFKGAFIDGHYSDVASAEAYVTAIPTISSSVGCFTNSQAIHRVLKRVHIRSHQGVTPTQALYLKAEVHTVASEEAYVAGMASMTRARSAHITGPQVTTQALPQQSYISNGVPVAIKYAFIVSGPQTFHRSYIVSSGVRTRIKSAFIAA